ncbi:hypothetical protein, partial [Pseudomonas sp. FG-3G]
DSIATFEILDSGGPRGSGDHAGTDLDAEQRHDQRAAVSIHRDCRRGHRGRDQRRDATQGQAL